MKSLDFEKMNVFVNEHIADFHQRRIASVDTLTLHRLLRKNPYLFKAKNLTTPERLIESLLVAFLSSSEEKLFGDFLEGLAVFVAQETCDGHKSAAQGVDLEFINRGVHYVVSIKSGPNWGNSSQHRRLAQDLKDAERRIKQARTQIRVEPVLGICYGKARTVRTSDGYLKVEGQNFWHLISENKDLYTEIIEPIGYRTKEHNDAFAKQRDSLVTRLAYQFFQQFCVASGEIDWPKLVEFNSGNFDLDNFL